MRIKLTKRRVALSHELKLRVAEEIENYISRNPGKIIPNTAIADKFGIHPQQVHTATNFLLRHNRLEQLSRKTYQIPMYESDLKEPEVPMPASNSSVDTAQLDIPSVIELAKTFNWETTSNNLREFVKWLEEKE